MACLQPCITCQEAFELWSSEVTNDYWDPKGKEPKPTYILPDGRYCGPCDPACLTCKLNWEAYVACRKTAAFRLARGLQPKVPITSLITLTLPKETVEGIHMLDTTKMWLYDLPTFKVIAMDGGFEWTEDDITHLHLVVRFSHPFKNEMVKRITNHLKPVGVKNTHRAHLKTQGDIDRAITYINKDSQNTKLNKYYKDLAIERYFIYRK